MASKRKESRWAKWMPQSHVGRAALAVAVALVLLVAAVAGLWAAGVVSFPRVEAALGLGDGPTGSVAVLEPDDGEALAAGDEIHGEASDEGVVYVWADGVNFAVPVTMDGLEWSYTYSGGLSGENRLWFSLVTPAGWGEAVSVVYSFEDAGAGGEEPSSTSFSDSLPAPLRVVFRPVERGIEAAAAFVERAVGGVVGGASGDGSGDLDANGVPDQWQGSPLSPASSVVGRVPYVNLGLVLFVLVGIPALVYLVRGRQINAYLSDRLDVARDRTRAKAELEKQRLEVVGRLKERQIEAARDVGKRRLAAVEGIHRARLKAAGRARSEQVRAVRDIRGKALDVRRAQVEGAADVQKAGIVERFRAIGRVKGR